MRSLKPLYQAVLFDLDGTLVDSLDDIAASLNHALTETGHPAHEREAIRRFVGDGARALIQRALAAGTPEAELDRVLSSYQARYRSHLVVATKPFDGIVPLLTGLSAQGVRLGVVTNKPDAPARAMVEQLFAPGTFGVVVGEAAGRPKKPSPAPALEAAAALGVLPADVAFVGDSPVDVQTALAAGMRAVAVAWGLRSVEELIAAGAHDVAHVPGELGPLLGLE